MPVMDGFKSSECINTFYNQMHSDPRFTHIKRPMIFGMTCFIENKKNINNSWATRRCQEIGMKGILYKPVARKGLVMQVEKCLGRELIEEMKKKALLKDNKKVKVNSKKKKEQRRDKSGPTNIWSKKRASLK